MRYNKPIMIATSVVVAIATTVGVISAATPNPPAPPEKTVSVKPAETTPTVTEITPVNDTQTPTPTEPTAPVVSQADQNRVAFQQVVSDAANTTALAINHPDPVTFVATQWACIDKFVQDGSGYGTYNTLLTDSAYIILQPVHNDDGTITYKYFDNQITCRVMQITL